MNEPEKRFYEFGPFRVDAEERQLLRDGEPQALTRKAFDTLLMLVRHSGRVLEKDEFMKQVWPDTFVEEANLANNISLLRKVLGESARSPFIQTVPGRGYRFVASVQAFDDAEPDLILEQHTLSSVLIEEVEQEHEEEKPAAEEHVEMLALPASASLTARPLAQSKPRRVLWLSLVMAALLAGLTLGLLLGKSFWKTSPPSFQQLTYHRGLVWSARFSPDGQNIIYSASWEGQPSAIFSMRSDSPESRSLGLTDLNILSISSAGEMAVLLHPHPQYGVTNRGTLARAPLSGGAPREIMENVQEADWSPDGKEMAVVRYEHDVCRLEYPVGNVLYEMAQPGWISHARVSPKGDMVAFLEHPVLRFDDRGTVAVVDLKGKKKRTLSKNYNTLFGLAWSPTGDEIWFTGGDSLDSALRAVNLSGQERTVLTGAGRLILQDIAPSGRLLLTREIVNLGIMGLPPGETKERDLTWLNGSYPVDMSDDGKTLLIDEEIIGGEGASSVYLRQTDNSPAVRLGDGTPIALSPDGRWVLARQRFKTPPQLILLPTGAGDAKVLPSDGINYFEAGRWFPDSKRLLLIGKEPGHDVRSFELNIESGERRAITPEGVTGNLISPDGKFIIASSGHQTRMLFPLDGGEPRMLPGLEAADQLIRWSADGRALYVAQGGLPVRVYKLDLATGRRELWKEINSADPAGLISIRFSRLSSDEKSYVYNYLRILSDLFIVEMAR